MDAQCIPAASPIVGWFIAAYGQVQSFLRQLGKWQTEAEAAQAKLPKNPMVAEAQDRKCRAEATAKAAEAKLVVAQAEEAAVKEAIDSLRPERRLSSFIETRARSADYRGQLGLVSLARRDFNELSSIFTDAEALSRRKKDHPDQAGRLDSLSSSVDRVVLFIDDLDRCEPEKVVAVLQAVHLLLAFPLFVVVVGVDQRCLRQSLRMRLKGLLTPSGPDSPVEGESSAHEDEMPATPLDYLEKIFHIPFHLPPMEKVGFETLIEKLTKPAKPSASFVGRSEQNETIDSLVSPPSGQIEAVPDESNLDRLDEKENEESDSLVGETSMSSVRVVGSVPLTDWERQALKGYYTLIRTPRGATRLLNTYRLVRAGVPFEEWNSFRGDEGGAGEFRLAMLLLAVSAGQAAIASAWFKLLRQDGTANPSHPQVAEANRSSWEEFCRMYEESSKQVKVPWTPDLIKKWVDRVERFTF